MSPTNEEILALTPARTARLILVTPDGTVVGGLPPVAVSTPWWQDIGPVVTAVRDRYGIAVSILRLIEADRDRPHGGSVTYLAEVAEPVPADPWTRELDDHPLRQPYARPGGPAADLAWAYSILADRGVAVTGAPVQVRTWNLSSLWRVPTNRGEAWLKVVPPFFAHEGKLLSALNSERLPRPLGIDGGRMLLAEVPGEDMYDARLPDLLAMVGLLTGLQASLMGRTGELLALGLIDWRAPALTAAIADVVERNGEQLSAADRKTLGRFVSSLPSRFAEIAACGLNDTLVHGDFHPGNVRGADGQLTILDWADSSIGSPLLDRSAFLDRVADDARPAVEEHWNRKWREHLPGSDPARAAALISPVAAARQAVVYQRFLDAIEPSEHPYHRHDPGEWLGGTAALLRDS